MPSCSGRHASGAFFRLDLLQRSRREGAAGGAPRKRETPEQNARWAPRPPRRGFAPATWDHEPRIPRPVFCRETETYKPGNRALRRWRWLYTLRAPNGNGVTGNARGSGRKHERLSIEELLVLVPVHNPVVPFSSQGTGLQRQLQAETMTAQSTTS